MKLAHINVGLLALGAICLLAGPSGAAVNPLAPKIALHVKATTTKSPCSILALADNCANVVPQGVLYPQLYHMQVIVDRGDSLTMDDGMAGVQFGLDYQGAFAPSGGTPIDVYEWILCATLQFATTTPQWPGPGSANLITWDAVNSCQRTRISCAGYFYMAAYAPATFRLMKRPSDGVAKVAACGSQEVILPDGALGFAAFSASGTTMGCNPCLTDCAPVPTIDATWSRMKTLVH